jgi:cytochrome c-type biogenesis protein CcmH/NrfF
MTLLRSFWLWVGALVVIVALAVGTAPSAPSSVSRINHLERLVRCPACDDLSVAVSNATSAIAVRHEIVRDVRAGESDNKILTSLEATYGPSILLSPSTSGLGILLWAVPAAVVVLIVVIALRLAKRRR